jgi:hypothetical protein
MARFRCVLAATVALGSPLLAVGDPASPEVKPTFDHRKHEARNEDLRLLVDESIELSRSLALEAKENGSVSRESRDRLAELNQELKRLHDEQTEETRKLKAAAEAAKSAPPQDAAPGTSAKEEPAEFDPSDVYFQGWQLSRDADKLQAEKKHAQALEKLLLARQLFEAIAEQWPDWKPALVKSRLATTKEKLSALPSSGK